MGCSSCGNPLDAGQRYCLECGAPNLGSRVPLPSPTFAPSPGSTGEQGPEPVRWQRFGGVWGVAALLLVALAAGVVIGRSGHDDAPAAAAAPVVRISGASIGGAAPAAASGPTGVTDAVQQTAAADEWPAGKAGWTVSLQELPKTTTSQVMADAAKADATTKGAKGVGVLDGEAHGLDAGELVLYAGVKSSRAAAAKDLKALKVNFPDAKVVKVEAAGGTAASSATPASGTVSKAQLKSRQSLSTQQYQQQSKKLPKTTALPGKPPPKDNKAPGGGSTAETIG